MSDSAILITGGAGFIGSALVRRWVKQTSRRILVVDKLTYAGNLDSLDPVVSESNFAFEEADIGDAARIAAVLRRHKVGSVLHLAAETHVDRSIDGPNEFAMTNVIGTLTLLEVSLRHWEALAERDRQEFRFLNVSTDEVYGSLGETGSFRETTAYSPNSPYSASKASADHFARAYHHTYGLPVIVTNCSNNYGPYQFPEKLIPLITLNAMEGRPLPVYGDGQQVRDWLHVDDHCSALRLLLERGTPGETYNIGGQCERANLEIVETICDIVDEVLGRVAGTSRNLIEFVADRPGHDRRYAVDIGKIQSELSWRPEHDFQSGLRDTVQWYIENQEWIRRVASGEYRVRRGLG